MKVILAFKHKLSDRFSTRLKQKIIQKWTRSPYYHVEIIIDGEWIEADNSKGLVRHKLRPLSDAYHYVEVPVNKCAHTQNLVDSFIDSQMGSKYDWVGIFLSQVIKLGVDKKDKWFCSEFVSKILQIYNVEPFIYVKPENMSPKDVFEISLKACNGERISDYRISKINDIISSAQSKKK